MISKVNGRLKRYDVSLFKHYNGQYVMQRITKVRKNDYVICGTTYSIARESSHLLARTSADGE